MPILIFLLLMALAFSLYMWSEADNESKRNRELYKNYVTMWKVAEQDNKWLRTLLQNEYEAPGKVAVPGTKLGDTPDQVSLDTQEDE